MHENKIHEIFFINIKKLSYKLRGRNGFKLFSFIDDNTMQIKVIIRICIGISSFIHT